MGAPGGQNGVVLGSNLPIALDMGGPLPMGPGGIGFGHPLPTGSIRSYIGGGTTNGKIQRRKLGKRLQ